MSRSTGLTKRQFEREAFAAPVEFIVAPDYREQVRFSANSAAAEPHIVRGEAVDISSGGFGLALGQFLPRQCEGTLRIYSPRSRRTLSDRLAMSEVLFEHPVKVRRIATMGRRPMYAVGVAFVDPAPGMEQTIDRLRCELGDDAAAGETGDA